MNYHSGEMVETLPTTSEEPRPHTLETIRNIIMDKFGRRGLRNPHPSDLARELQVTKELDWGREDGNK